MGFGEGVRGRFRGEKCGRFFMCSGEMLKGFNRGSVCCKEEAFRSRETGKGGVGDV